MGAFVSAAVCLHALRREHALQKVQMQSGCGDFRMRMARLMEVLRWGARLPGHV